MKSVYKKLLRILGVAIALHFTLVFTNNIHLYTTLENTIFKGRLGPEIDEFQIFENREVLVGIHEPWNENLSGRKLSQTELELHTELKSVAFLVIKNDSIEFEQYWEGYNSDSRSNSFSMAKSLVSMAIGAALQDGFIESLDQTIDTYLPEFNGGDSVSIKNLLTMSSGIDFDENYLNPFAYPAKANYGTDLKSLTLGYKWYKTGGENFEYLSGNTQLLAFIIEKATKMTLSEYFSSRIWSKVGAKNSALWSLDAKDGNEKAFCCFNSNARDFARLGKLYLNKGTWNGVQLVPDWYVEESVSPFDFKEIDGPKCKRYGYQWWLTEYNNKPVFYARGILGQYIIVIPEDNLVICRLGHKRIKPKNYDPPGELEKYIEMAYRLSE
ncbi:MAG: serine hydrolase domain-containing protein [Salibacteraceae bacterium]